MRITADNITMMHWSQHTNFTRNRVFMTSWGFPDVDFVQDLNCIIIQTLWKDSPSITTAPYLANHLESLHLSSEVIIQTFKNSRFRNRTINLNFVKPGIYPLWIQTFVWLPILSSDLNFQLRCFSPCPAKWRHHNTWKTQAEELSCLAFNENREWHMWDLERSQVPWRVREQILVGEILNVNRFLWRAVRRRSSHFDRDWIVYNKMTRPIENENCRRMRHYWARDYIQIPKMMSLIGRHDIAGENNDEFISPAV